MEERQLNVHQRINAIMRELDYIQKGEARVNGQYRFASHDQVTEAIHPYLVKYGINIIPSTRSMKQEGNRTEGCFGFTFVNIDEPKDCFTVEFCGYGVDPSDKGPGKAISYAYKCCVLKTFNLATGEDPDQDQKSVYEPLKCLEFDGLIPEEYEQDDRLRLNRFLADCAETTNKHVEDVKREAIKRMPEFLKAFKAWKGKK